MLRLTRCPYFRGSSTPRHTHTVQEIQFIVNKLFINYNYPNYLIQIVFAKGAHYALPQLANIGYDVVGIDWTIDPAVAR